MRLAAHGQALDGGDLLADRVLGGGLAGAHGGAVEMHRAGAAQARAATELGTGHLQMLADYPEQGRVVLDIGLLLLAVDGECQHVPSGRLGLVGSATRAVVFPNAHSILVAPSVVPIPEDVKERYSISARRQFIRHLTDEK